LSESGRSSGAGRGGGRASSAAEAPTRLEPADRPGASGHRFGPDLACSECGIQWDAHQREPKPCKTETSTDAFTRRPVVSESAPKVPKGTPAAAPQGASPPNSAADFSSTSRPDVRDHAGGTPAVPAPSSGSEDASGVNEGIDSKESSTGS
jgi:hypothetical protein